MAGGVGLVYHCEEGADVGAGDAVSGTEYVLLVLVILVPAVIATGVTLWSLEQVRMRSKRNRKRRASPKPRSDAPPNG